MKIYIEKYDLYEGFILLDFINISDFIEFCQKIDTPYNENDQRTMLCIEGLRFKKGIYPREGMIYNFPLELIHEVNWERESDPDGELEGSDIIAFRTQMNLKKFSYFSKSLSIQNSGKAESTWIQEPCGGLRIKENIDIVVKNVGQGNWNEIYSDGKCCVIYDLGSSIHLKNSEIKNIIHNSMAFEDRPSLVISHWDIDHYKAIFQAKNEQLNKICCVLCPSELPNLTSKRAFDVIRKNCNFINTLSPIKTRKVKRKVSVELEYKYSNFLIFNGEKSSDRNKSGISIVVWNKTSAIILPADHHYFQIFNDMYGHIPLGREINIITPHHGGKAGNPNVYIGKISNANIAITSTGKNSYGHPDDNNRKILSKIGFSWMRTDNVGKDIKIKL